MNSSSYRPKDRRLLNFCIENTKNLPLVNNLSCSLPHNLNNLSCSLPHNLTWSISSPCLICNSKMTMLRIFPTALHHISTLQFEIFFFHFNVNCMYLYIFFSFRFELCVCVRVSHTHTHTRTHVHTYTPPPPSPPPPPPF